jgi:hypothetical protein
VPQADISPYIACWSTPVIISLLITAVRDEVPEKKVLHGADKHAALGRGGPQRVRDEGALVHGSRKKVASRKK